MPKVLDAAFAPLGKFNSRSELINELTEEFGEEEPESIIARQSNPIIDFIQDRRNNISLDDLPIHPDNFQLTKFSIPAIVKETHPRQLELLREINNYGASYWQYWTGSGRARFDENKEILGHIACAITALLEKKIESLDFDVYPLLLASVVYNSNDLGQQACYANGDFNELFDDICQPYLKALSEFFYVAEHASLTTWSMIEEKNKQLLDKHGQLLSRLSDEAALANAGIERLEGERDSGFFSRFIFFFQRQKRRELATAIAKRNLLLTLSERTALFFEPYHIKAEALAKHVDPLISKICKLDKFLSEFSSEKYKNNIQACLEEFGALNIQETDWERCFLKVKDNRSFDSFKAYIKCEFNRLAEKGSDDAAEFKYLRKLLSNPVLNKDKNLVPFMSKVAEFKRITKDLDLFIEALKEEGRSKKIVELFLDIDKQNTYKESKNDILKDLKQKLKELSSSVFITTNHINIANIIVFLRCFPDFADKECSAAEQLIEQFKEENLAYENKIKKAREIFQAQLTHLLDDDCDLASIDEEKLKDAYQILGGSENSLLKEKMQAIISKVFANETPCENMINKFNLLWSFLSLSTQVAFLEDIKVKIEAIKTYEAFLKVQPLYKSFNHEEVTSILEDKSDTFIGSSQTWQKTVEAFFKQPNEADFSTLNNLAPVIVNHPNAPSFTTMDVLQHALRYQLQSLQGNPEEWLHEHLVELQTLISQALKNQTIENGRTRRHSPCDILCLTYMLLLHELRLSDDASCAKYQAFIDDEIIKSFLENEFFNDFYSQRLNEFYAGLVGDQKVSLLLKLSECLAKELPNINAALENSQCSEGKRKHIAGLLEFLRQQAEFKVDTEQLSHSQGSLATHFVQQKENIEIEIAGIEAQLGLNVTFIKNKLNTFNTLTVPEIELMIEKQEKLKAEKRQEILKLAAEAKGLVSLSSIFSPSEAEKKKLADIEEKQIEEKQFAEILSDYQRELQKAQHVQKVMDVHKDAKLFSEIYAACNAELQEHIREGTAPDQQQGCAELLVLFSKICEIDALIRDLNNESTVDAENLVAKMSDELILSLENNNELKQLSQPLLQLKNDVSKKIAPVLISELNEYKEYKPVLEANHTENSSTNVTPVIPRKKVRIIIQDSLNSNSADTFKSLANTPDDSTESINFDESFDSSGSATSTSSTDPTPLSTPSSSPSTSPSLSISPFSIFTNTVITRFEEARAAWISPASSPPTSTTIPGPAGNSPSS